MPGVGLSPFPPPNVVGFIDGRIEALGAFDAKWRKQPHPLTGNPQIDAVLQQEYDPAERIKLWWDTTGDVSLARNGGTTALQLTEPATGNSSVAQTVLISPNALSVTFDLGIIASSDDNTLNILLDKNLLKSIPLGNMPPMTHITVSLPPNIRNTGTFTFSLTSPTQSAASITLGNFAISSIATR